MCVPFFYFCKQKMKRLLFILLLSISFDSFSQESNGIIPDSLILKLQQATSKDRNRINVLDLIVTKYYESENYELAEPYLDEIKAIAKLTNSNYAKLICRYYELYLQFINDDMLDNIYKIYEIQNEMSSLGDDDDSNILRFKLYNMMSKFFMKLQTLPQAYNCLIKCDEINKKLKKNYFDVITNHNLILFYLNINDFNECIKIGKDVVARIDFKDKIYENYKYMIYSNIAMAYIQLKDYKTAEKYIDTTETLAGNKAYLWDIMLKKGMICYYKKDYKNALEFSQKGLNLNGSMNKIKMISAYEIMAMSYNELGKCDTAIALIDKALDIAKDISSIHYEKMILHDKTSILYNCGKCDEVYENIIATEAIDDSLTKLRDIENVDRMRIQQIMTDYEAKIKYENYVRDQKERMNRLILIFIVLLLLTSVVLLIVMMHKRKLRHKLLEDELEQRNREMASSVVVMMKKNEVINQVLKQLKDIKEASEEKNTKKGISKVSKKIEKTMDENFFQEFDISFKRIQPDFIDKLQKNYPDLTPNEIRICSFLKLNMSTKDIANLTGQSVTTIEMARYRLRRKFGLPMDEHVHLTNFIAKM